MTIDNSLATKIKVRFRRLGFFCIYSSVGFSGYKSLLTYLSVKTSFVIILHAVLVTL